MNPLKNIMIIYFATSNLEKFKEVKDNANLTFKQLNIEIDEIQGTKENIAMDKLQKACKHHPDKWIMIDDTSIELKGLNGFPGPYGKDFIKIGFDCIENLVSKIGRETTASCILGLGNYKTKTYKLFTGSINGHIVKGKEEGGFGFSNIFLPVGYEQTFGEMSTSLKNKISHRAIALEKLQNYVEDEILKNKHN